MAFFLSWVVERILYDSVHLFVAPSMSAKRMSVIFSVEGFILLMFTA